MAKAAKKSLSKSLPSFLNFNRSISPSEGLMSGLTPDGKKMPVEVVSRGVRGSISSYGNVYKNAETQKSDNINKQLDPKNANLQQIESAFMPVGATRLVVEFSLVVQANSLVPSGCNDPVFYDKLKDLAAAYAAIGGYAHLGERYLWNVINGRMLWRNRFASAKRAKITVDGENYEFNVDNMNLSKFDSSSMPEGFDKIAAKFGDALAGSVAPLFVTVEMSGEMPMGAEVYPSQEFLPDAAKAKDAGKVLSKVTTTFGSRTDYPQATLHSQKIGNAIRVIDEWHDFQDEYGITAVEAYGYVQSRSDAVRIPGRSNDIYSLLLGIEEHTETLRNASSASEVPGDIHYMMAMLVRGGVFSGDSKSKGE